MDLPPIVSNEEWQRAHEALQAKEKEATRARDGLAAERRRQPRLEFSTDYAFEGPDGVVSFLDLFEGRRQLIVYASCGRHHSYGGVCGYPGGESSQVSWRPNGARSRNVQTLPSASTPRLRVSYGAER